MIAAVEEHYTEQARLAALIGLRAVQNWDTVSVRDFGRWVQLLRRVAALVSAGQFNAARSAEPYVRRALDQQRVKVKPDAELAPSGFMGVAADGRSLSTLLDQPRINALVDIRDGADPEEAHERARNQLQMLAVSTVQDAGRAAEQVAIGMYPEVGWVRMVNPPCCERCAILAGRWYRFNDGFLRHPRCDCVMVPSQEDVPDDIRTDVDALFKSGQVKGLKDAERQAIEDGADVFAVVNSDPRRRKSMSTAEATRRRNSRVTPGAIYQQAASREEALRLLKVHGYVL